MSNSQHCTVRFWCFSLEYIIFELVFKPLLLDKIEVNFRSKVLSRILQMLIESACIKIVVKGFCPTWVV